MAWLMYDSRLSSSAFRLWIFLLQFQIIFLYFFLNYLGNLCLLQANVVSLTYAFTVVILIFILQFQILLLILDWENLNFLNFLVFRVLFAVCIFLIFLELLMILLVENLFQILSNLIFTFFLNKRLLFCWSFFYCYLSSFGGLAFFLLLVLRLFVLLLLWLLKVFSFPFLGVLHLRIWILLTKITIIFSLKLTLHNASFAMLVIIVDGRVTDFSRLN